LDIRIAGRVRLGVGGPHDAGDQTDCQKDPANDDRDLVHAIENLQRWQTGVKEAEMLRLDLFEQQDVGDADHRGDRERRVSKQQR
jgi:hypothetical protein